MQKITLRMLIELLVIAIMLFGWITMLYTGYRGLRLEESEKTSKVSRFNPLRYGFQIFLISTLALVFISRRRVINERAAIGIIIFGMFSLCQPFTIALYRCGFQTLLVGTLAFIIISHMSTETQSRGENLERAN